MKMKELERVTGLGRETIRYYIREGLLPEPERPKKNVAIYGKAHVRRLELIKRLQQERYLPLNLIKTIVTAEADNPVTGFEAFIGLETRLGPLLSERSANGATGLAPRRFTDVVKEAGLSMADARALVEMGVVTVDRRDDEEWLNHRNARVMELVGEWRAAGFTDEAGFGIDTHRIYAELADALAHRSVAQFYNNFGEKVTTEKAVQMAVQGITLINEMMPLLRVEKIIREVERVNVAGALDGDDGETE
ncbi:MAG: MerR family transcriptional regulator [Parvibaculum sp.]